MKFNLDISRMGYFILYKTDNSFFNQQIVNAQLKRGFSKKDSQYTHVETAGGGKDSINISPPLSKLVDITKEHKGRYACIVRYKNEDYEKKGRYKVAFFSATLCNLKYDITGVLNFLFKWITQNNRNYFCSEGCLWALQREYPGAIFIKPHECMPANFLDDRYFELVWEGIIC